MLKLVRRTIEDYTMITPGELVIVGVSGGPDSIALLHSLYKLSGDLNFSLHVVHVNHGLRPEAGEEELFVIEFAKSLGIGTTVHYLDPAELREGSLQELAREKRQEIFRQECVKLGASKVALGHNANDQAETVLQRLLRGGGASGLGGIHPKRGILIRPMLFIPRKEIEIYLRQEGLEFRVDKSNFKTVYLRNKIRLNLIPDLEKEYNPKLVDALGKTAIILQEDNNYLEQEAEQKLDQHMQRVGKALFWPRELNSLPKAILTRVIRKMYATLVNDPRGLEYDQVVKVVNFCLSGRSGGTLELPGNIRVLKELDGILIYVHPLVWPEITERELFIPGATVFGEHSTINSRIVDQTSLDPSNLGVLAVNYAGLPQPISIRSRKPGDRILIRGSYRKLKEIYNALRVPKRIRETTPIILIGGEIAWIPGIIKSSKFSELNGSGPVLELSWTNF